MLFFILSLITIKPINNNIIMELFHAELKAIVKNDYFLIFKSVMKTYAQNLLELSKDNHNVNDDCKFDNNTDTLLNLILQLNRCCEDSQNQTIEINHMEWYIIDLAESIFIDIKLVLIIENPFELSVQVAMFTRIRFNFDNLEMAIVSMKDISVKYFTIRKQVLYEIKLDIIDGIKCDLKIGYNYLVETLKDMQTSSLKKK